MVDQRDLFSKVPSSLNNRLIKKQRDSGGIIINKMSKIKDESKIETLIESVRVDPIKENKDMLYRAIKDYNKLYGEKYTKTG